MKSAAWLASWAVLTASTVLAQIPSGAPAGATADAALTSLADEYFETLYFPENPTTATLEGIHRYDEALEDYTRAGVERQVRALRAFEKRFTALNPELLSERMRGDRELLLSNIRGSLLELETIARWRKNPDTYPTGITNSAFSIMERNFAPPDERLRRLIAREKLMPNTLLAARANLVDPPEIYTKIAIEQLPGDISFFTNDLPAAFKDADDANLKQQFAKSNAAVIAALQAYQAWLTREVLPRSHGEFRLGAQNFRAKLLVDEMVDTPLDQLLAIGAADLRRNQADYTRIAKQLEPGKTARQVLTQLAAYHPDPAELLDSFRATFDGLIHFITTRHIVAIPSTIRPILHETPPFMRATTFASMDTPGPYETGATEAYFNVTLPDPSWDKQRVEGFMAGFNYPVIRNTAVHEAYPGHYVQFLWLHNVDDRVRKLLGANSNVEGWAHYCEQMMLEEGFGEPGVGAKDARDALMMHLGQLQDALLRDARYIVAIKMHTQGMTLAQAEDFFVNEGYQSREVGEAETKRGTSDPTYLYYTLGKLQILKLRRDLQARDGNHFRLEEFHNAFLQQGFPPMKLVRHALLHDDSPTL